VLVQCESVEPEFAQLQEVDTLTDYAVEVRYPDNLFEPTREEAREALDIAQKVKDFVQKRIVIAP
jgi:HEPN domain-containing protein